MTIISKDSENNKESEDKIRGFFKLFKVLSVLRRFGADRKNGYQLNDVWTFIFSLIFTERNLYRTVHSEGYSGMGNDVVHRFLNNVKIHWEKVLVYVSIAVIIQIAPLTSENRRNAIVVDDTPYSRDRSKKVELLSKCKDHSKNCYYKGFRDLSVGWTDGVDFIPFAFQLMASSNSEKRLCEAKKHDGRTLAARRRKAAVKPMPERLLDLLKMSKTMKIPADYVLFDTWFASPKSLINITNIGYHVVAMLSRDNTKYLYDGEKKSLTQMYHLLKKRPGKSKYLSSAFVTIVDSEGSNAFDVKLVFVRNKNNKKDWRVLVSTDLSLSEQDIIELYGKRWCIEVFFKTCKSHLKLAKEYQGRSYDMLTAHTTIVYLRYVMLAWFSRQETDFKTINDGFFQLCDEKADITFAEALRFLLNLVQSAFAEIFWLDPEQLSELMDAFIAKLPSSLQHSLRFASRES
jgi:hypothetical protein